MNAVGFKTAGFMDRSCAAGHFRIRIWSATAMTALTELLLVSPDPYLDHLTSLPLPTLLAEPTALKTQSHHLSSSLSALTQASYPTFLSLHQASAALSADLSSLSDSLHSLLNDSLPILDQCLATWSDTTDSLLRHRNSSRLVLDQHDRLRDLLDVPLLIDTCVRNGYFAEALSLIAHASSLSSSSPSPITRSLQAQVHLSNTHMLLALLSTLHEPTRKLPALWKVVNFLRRMAVLDSDTQIAAAFLGARETCLRSALDGSGRDVQALILAATPENRQTTAKPTHIGEKERDDIARYLRKYIDVWREGVHDIVTQYTTIFLDKKPSSNDTEPSSPDLRKLLTTYTSHALTTHLLPVLRTHLPLVPTALPSLLTQLTYCATAFASVGMDFRPLLSDLFATAVRTSVSTHTSDALAQFTARVASATKTQSVLKPSEWLSRVGALPPPPSVEPPHGSRHPPHIPPTILASYPPLAEFLNALLGALNALRLLAPVDIMSDLLDAFEDVLAEGLRALLVYARDGWGAAAATTNAEKERENAVLGEVGAVYMRVLVPFVRRALVEGVYGVEMAGADRVRMSERLREAVGEWETWVDGLA